MTTYIIHNNNDNTHGKNDNSSNSSNSSDSTTVSFHNFKSQDFKLSVSNPKSKYVAYLSVLSRISNCQGLGRKNKFEILKLTVHPIFCVFLSQQSLLARFGSKSCPELGGKLFECQNSLNSSISNLSISAKYVSVALYTLYIYIHILFVLF